MRLLNEELAVVWLEVEAKIAENTYPGAGITIDPHHLTSAKRLLLTSGRAEENHAKTRGGRVVTTLTPGDKVGRQRKIDEAAAHKRRLHARYLGWATGRDATIGAAGEQVVHDSLSAAAPEGYRLLARSGRGLEQVFGHEVPYGPLDHGAHLQLWTPEGDHGHHATVLIEVKNIREWIYPKSSELHQLLAKAAAVQRLNSDRPLLPILVCRRANKTAFRAARTLGFLIIDSRRQYLLPRAYLDEAPGDRALLNEVRTALGFLDLIEAKGPDPVLTKMLGTTVPQRLPDFPDRWREVGANFENEYRALWQASSAGEQDELLRELRQAVREAVGQQQLGW